MNSPRQKTIPIYGVDVDQKDMDLGLYEQENIVEEKKKKGKKRLSNNPRAVDPK